jgi:hypothetical protein
MVIPKWLIGDVLVDEETGEVVTVSGKYAKIWNVDLQIEPGTGQKVLRCTMEPAEPSVSACFENIKLRVVCEGLSEEAFAAALQACGAEDFLRGLHGEIQSAVEGGRDSGE